MTDYEANDIIQSIMIPQFRNGNYDAAVLLAWDRLEKLARKEVFPKTESGKDFDWFQALFWFVWFLIMFGGMLGSLLSGTKSWWLGGVI